MAESNDSLPPGWLRVHRDQLWAPRSVTRKPLPLPLYRAYLVWDNKARMTNIHRGGKTIMPRRGNRSLSLQLRSVTNCSVNNSSRYTTTIAGTVTVWLSGTIHSSMQLLSVSATASTAAGARAMRGQHNINTRRCVNWLITCRRCTVTLHVCSEIFWNVGLLKITILATTDRPDAMKNSIRKMRIYL